MPRPYSQLLASSRGQVDVLFFCRHPDHATMVRVMSIHTPRYIYQLVLQRFETVMRLNKTIKPGNFNTLPSPCREDHNIHDALSSKLIPHSRPCCLCFCTRPDPLRLRPVTNTHHLQLVQLVPQFRLPQPQLAIRRSLVLQPDRHRGCCPLCRSRRSLPPLRHTARPRRMRRLLLVMRWTAYP